MGKIHLIGNAHLDAVWLWRWQEGYSEVLATFRSALERIKEFDGFIFTCAGAFYYRWVEETDPEMFEEIKQRVAEGRWVIVGGQLIQPDCNMPCGESFARHALYAQNYYKEKFGVTARVGYNVDSFGHNAMLPQILKNSGMDYYVFMRPDKNEISLPFEDSCFMWEAPDGTKIPAFRIIESYLTKGFGDVEDKAIEHKKLSDELGGKPLMCFYGVGNHGGGPTIKNILTVKQLQAQKGGEDFIFSSPNGFFEDINKDELPEYKGDLFHHASGCYSSVMSIKSLNRISEAHLLNAEKAGVMSVLSGVKKNTENLKDAWETTLFNHFHDIAGGCCIKSAVKDAESFFGKSICEADTALNRALQAMAWNIDTSKGNPVVFDKVKFKLWENADKGTPVTVFNLNSFAVKTPIRLGITANRVEDCNGLEIPTQSVRSEATADLVSNTELKLETEIIAEIPPMGWKVYLVFGEKALADTAESSMESGGFENEYFRVEVSGDGCISSVYDKKSDRKLCGAIEAAVIDETDCDTWAHGKFVFDNVCGKFGNARIIGFEDGAVCKRLRAVYTYNSSELMLEVGLYSGIPTVFINARVKWNEKHKMLKLVFPSDVKANLNTASVPFGFSERLPDGKEQPMQKWVTVSDGEYGLGLASDTRSAYDIKDNAIRLTALRSPIYADHYGKRDSLAEYTEQGVQSFKLALMPVCRDYSNLYRLSENLLNPPVALFGTYHFGKLPCCGSMLELSADNVAVTAFKSAENGDGYIIRCHEISGKTAETDIEIPLLGIKSRVEFKPQQIRSFRISNGRLTETDFTEK